MHPYNVVRITGFTSFSDLPFWKLHLGLSEYFTAGLNKTQQKKICRHCQSLCSTLKCKINATVWTIVPCWQAAGIWQKKQRMPPHPWPLWQGTSAFQWSPHTAVAPPESLNLERAEKQPRVVVKDVGKTKNCSFTSKQIYSGDERLTALLHCIMVPYIVSWEKIKWQMLKF